MIASTERRGCVTFEMNPRDSLRSPDFNRPTDLSPLAGLTLAGFPANYQNLSTDADFPRATDFNYPDEKRAGIVREIRIDGKNGGVPSCICNLQCARANGFPCRFYEECTVMILRVYSFQSKYWIQPHY